MLAELRTGSACVRRRAACAGLNSVYAMYLLVRHCKSLEEGSFRGRSADFLWMLLLGAGAMVATAPWSKLHMFGHSLSFMVMYLWAKRNPDLRLSIFGIINCTAPYWPWINVLFAVLMGASPKADLLGIAVGHVYYFLEDVYPRMPGHRRWLGAPAPLKALFGERRAPAAAAQGVAGDAQRQAEGQQHAHID